MRDETIMKKFKAAEDQMQLLVDKLQESFQDIQSTLANNRFTISCIYRTLVKNKIILEEDMKTEEVKLNNEIKESQDKKQSQQIAVRILQDYKRIKVKDTEEEFNAYFENWIKASKDLHIDDVKKNKIKEMIPGIKEEIKKAHEAQERKILYGKHHKLTGMVFEEKDQPTMEELRKLVESEEKEHEELRTKYKILTGKEFADVDVNMPAINPLRELVEEARKK